MTVLAAKHWGSNANMMVDVCDLWVDLDNDMVLDPTYGHGGFWKKVRPAKLVGTDLNAAKSPNWQISNMGLDFTDMPHYWANRYNVVVFDPSYMVSGGRETSTIDEFNERYDVPGTEKRVYEQWEKVILPGMAECVRVLAPRGLLMQKGCNYISGSTFHNFRQLITAEMVRLGLVQVDEFILVRKSGSMQDKGRTRKCRRCKGTGEIQRPLPGTCPACEGEGAVLSEQQHARNNYSFLIIARKPA